jgi:hypothetical protein
MEYMRAFVPGPRGIVTYTFAPDSGRQGAMKKHWMIVAATGLAAAGGLAFVQGQAGQQADESADAQASIDAADSREQPIQFPHDIHAGTAEGQFGIDCQYCHFSAERSVDAGIPPVATCMGCHTMIPGENNPEEVTKLRGYAERGEPIPWVRIHKVADHAHFPHMRHINAGLECQQCHGPIEEQGVLEAPLPEWGKGKMGWCVSCHVEQGASRDCTVCHY